MKIQNFIYNGFMGKLLPGTAPYEVEFIEWTEDPGIGKFKCSDGIERLIPSFALIGKGISLPKQEFKTKNIFNNDGVLFGKPSHS